MADTVTWTGAGDGTTLNDGANWSANAVPGSADTAVLEPSAPLRVTATDHLTWSRLAFRGSSPIELDLNGFTNTLSATSFGDWGAVAFSSDATISNGVFRATGSSSTILGEGHTIFFPTNTTASFRKLVFGSSSKALASSGNKLLITDATNFSVSDAGDHGDALVFTEGYSVSNTLEVTGNSNVKFEQLDMMGQYDTLRLLSVNNGIDNETTYANVCTIGGTHNLAEIANGYAPHWSIGGSFNTLCLSNTWAGGYIAVAGTSNTVRLVANAKTGTAQPNAGRNITLDGVGNVLELEEMTASGCIQGILLKGEDCTVRVVGSSVMAPLPKFVGHTEPKTFEISGVTWSNPLFAFSGANMTYEVRDKGVLTYPIGAASTMNNFNFVPGASNVILRIAQNGTVDIAQGMNSRGSDKNNFYNWTNCVDCAIEFTGRNPAMTFTDSSAYTLGVFGTEDEEPLVDAVRLRFVVPTDNYTQAPVRQTKFKGKYIYLYGNQPIEVKMAGAEKYPAEPMSVPLVYENTGFGKTPMDEERLAKLNANAILPRGAKLVYRNKTLYCDIPKAPACASSSADRPLGSG